MPASPPTDHLPVLSGIQPAELRRMGATLSLAHRGSLDLARLGIRISEWTNHKWKMEYCEGASRLRAFVPETGARPVGMGLPRAAWVKLNRLRTGVG